MGLSWGDIWKRHEIENLSLIRAFVITHQGILILTCYDNLITVVIYVMYRLPFPDEESVNLVKKKLKENNIEYSQLMDWPMRNCEISNS